MEPDALSPLVVTRNSCGTCPANRTRVSSDWTADYGALPVVSPGRKRAFGGCALVQIIRFTSWTVWGAVSGAGAQPYLGARTRIVRRQDDRWGVIAARCCLRPLGL